MASDHLRAARSATYASMPTGHRRQYGARLRRYSNIDAMPWPALWIRSPAPWISAPVPYTR
jgi:hypothetical protein